MTTKLTLTIEQDVIKTAKSYASRKGRSLSDLVENYLRMLSTTESASLKLSPKIQRLKGSINVPDDIDFKEIVREARESKYGK